MSKNYNQAPLPFQGQKRRWNTEFKKALKQFDDCTVFVDLFGGSGLLSRMVKDARPDAIVYYNDFDDYHLRIDNIPRTNALLAELRIIVKGLPDTKLIPKLEKTAILEKIKEYAATGFVDYITLSSSLMFSMNYATTLSDLEKNSLYNNIRQTDYDATGYLNGIEVVKQDYRVLFDRFQHFPNVCFLIDPPYLSTDTGTYSNYWKLKEYLDVLHTLKNTNYFYFTSEKSNILELCEWLECNYSAGNPFHKATKKELTSHMNHSSKYLDIMLYKRRCDE